MLTRTRVSWHGTRAASVWLDTPNRPELRPSLPRLAGAPTERTELERVRTKPLPCLPEPLISIGSGLTARSLARADRRGGRRNLWLRLLDRAGLGFDS